ncbi:MAG: Translation initiation factor IF-3 [Candidatus Anoxychlamydiales bacterium]|nr:Translation initiation factor IF-3 [Candidatus Anoxychlamydiales bacterium]NGX36613.1 Translation initiation factor IF-3 [Candidatus Anoxychlamydiales bacterium]
MRINRQIRAEKVRLISEEGKQVGVKYLTEALRMAEEADLDLVEIAPNAKPPVCKIVDYGKFKYQQLKKEKENRKAQHQVKVKEIKFKPNIDTHDFLTKEKHAREFIEKGYKVRISCVFRGREMLHTELGKKVIQRLIDDLKDIAVIEAPLKLMGRSMSTVLAPMSKRH